MPINGREGGSDTADEDACSAARRYLREERALWMPPKVAEYERPGDVVSFLRDHVAPSLPCVWRGAVRHWDAVALWSDNEYLRSKVGEERVQLAWTPDGRADAVLRVAGGERLFAMPAVESATVGELLDALEGGGGAGEDADSVPYYSAQDSSLTRELPALLDDVDYGALAFAEQAFAAPPEAQNIWIGDGRSLSSLHSDPYHNLYAVVRGKKRFELRPPCDAALLSKPRLQNARWIKSGAGAGQTAYAIEKEEGKTAWIDEDAIDESCGGSLDVELLPGDLLFLPGLWCKLSRLHLKRFVCYLWGTAL